MVALARQPQQEVNYLGPAVNIGYITLFFYVKLPLYFNLYYNKDNAGTHHFGMYQNSPIILNEDNTEPTTDGSHSHGGLLTGTTIQSSLPLDSGNYQIQTSCVASEKFFLIFGVVSAQ